jgi:hypothetical protein
VPLVPLDHRDSLDYRVYRDSLVYKDSLVYRVYRDSLACRVCRA